MQASPPNESIMNVISIIKNIYFILYETLDQFDRVILIVSQVRQPNENYKAWPHSLKDQYRASRARAVS